MGLLIKQHRLTDSRDFRAVFAAGRAFVHRLLILRVRRADENSPARLGFSTSSKLRKAVDRNRAKRLMREAFRSFEGRVKLSGYDAVVIARPPITDARFDDVREVLEGLLEKAGLLMPAEVVCDEE